MNGNGSEVETPGESALERQQPPFDVPLVPLQHYYERLSPLPRDVWGLNNPRFVSDEPWGTI
ncbi:hypothetical protein BS17DRAFT_880899 [Gyrodon lividus]|nr:hypothetical protein BS17DRAFT_880899 [Gyrodon lividus]